MPYKASGVWVMVKRRGKWVRYKKHDTHAEAAVHAAALNIHAHKKDVQYKVQ